LQPRAPQGLIGSTAARLLRSRGDEAVTLGRKRGRSRSAGPDSAPAGPPAVQNFHARRGRKPVSDLQAIADRVEIEALRGEFTDAVMMRDYDRLASLFTHDGAVRIPHINAEAAGREALGAGIERLQGLLDYFVQTTHPGTIQLDDDTAAGRDYLCELGRFRDGRSQLNYAIYHDRYQRTPDGWKLNQRVDKVRCLDTTPLAGSAPLYKSLDTTGGHHAHHRSFPRPPRLPGPGA
jgi:hypothetical protein